MAATQKLQQNIAARQMVAILGPVAGLWRHHHLVWQLVRRDVLSRYRGLGMGMAWSVVNPLVMLLVYTFVFSGIMKSRWPGTKEDSSSEFAIMLLAGYVVYSLFSECVSRSPTLVLGHANFVKKVIFPLEILPWVTMGTAIFNAATTLLVLLLGIWYVQGSVPVTALLFPLVIVPLIFTTIGLSSFLSATGVFYRDIGNVVSIALTILMFLSPIFYPLTAVPEAYRGWLSLNPLAYVIEDARKVLIRGQGIQWEWWAIQFLVSYILALLGQWWFQKTRKGFADVL